MRIEYYVGGAKRRVTVPTPADGRARRPVPEQVGAALPDIVPRGGDPVTVRCRAEALAALVPDMRWPGPESLGAPPPAVPTRMTALGGARTSEVAWLRAEFGLEVVAEGSHGKVLLAAPPDDADPVRLAARAAVAVYERGVVASAQPNFLRLMNPPGPATQAATTQWGLDNAGDPGVVGADVAARAAWTITLGDPAIRVAVLDDGVDLTHAFLKSAIVAQKDFVDGRATAAPEPGDGHGTACAGIIVSRDDTVRGLAPELGLVACRIMKNGPLGFVSDDFQTAEAIDWCWEQARADVLSSSWGEFPSDLIGEAFGRARTQGRDGRGAVVVIAAGNNQGAVRFPGNLPDILTVGATNEWDERKTTRSRDGETHWGSNFGEGLDLMAPGVHIRTTDRTSPDAGSAPVTDRFNGTSAATPFVAAAAALVLSVAPQLPEARVREILTSTADGLGPVGWDRFVGFGRVNVFAALRAARGGPRP